jgi:hypothetical protein
MRSVLQWISWGVNPQVNLMSKVSSAFFAIIVYAVVDVGVTSGLLRFVIFLCRLEEIVCEISSEMNLVTVFADSY